MGCRISKNDSVSDDTPGTMARQNTDADYKAKLERQMCLAKETPEPEFDLSGCAIKTVPSGVFILCRVLRKESLDLSLNKLHSMDGGGSILDLVLLKSLDIRHNLFKQLPLDVCYLDGLKELFISHNQLTKLPTAINQLKNLELLDCSDNQLTSISPVNCMTHLRVLNISGNDYLTQLPTELSTCDSIIDIICDVDTIVFPPYEVLALGTLEILNYLTTNSVGDSIDGDRPVKVTNEQRKTKMASAFIQEERGEKLSRIDAEKYTKERMMIEQERLATEKNAQYEAEVHQIQQKRREELLQQLIVQQTENDSLVSRVQQEKDSERNKLITDILTAEENSSLVVEKLLALKIEPDATLLEQEQQEQEYILEQLRIQHSDLRKQEVLSAMTDILAGEQRSIETYQQQRDATAREILQRETESNEILNNVYWHNDKDRTSAVVKIMQDEDLQKTAVCSLIAKNDSRTWALMEQVRIVESQLASMTHIEIERRKLSVDERLTELSERRMNLTYVLLDLMDQQEQRKKQLLDTLANMENQKQNEQDFWLLQYQKLLDAQPIDLSQKSASLDPLLGYNFLLNGVVHCLPFLSKIWQSKQKDLADITDEDLLLAGVKKETDRRAILRSLHDYIYHENSMSERVPSAPPHKNMDSSHMAEPDLNEATIKTISPEKTQIGETLAECVVCMEESCKIIFLPCGHLCCCSNCHEALQMCPMCRSAIERRIKVIQP